jgi:hypothetical protein
VFSEVTKEEVVMEDWGLSLGRGLYFYAAAFLLAQLEIQIEGPKGWAAALPTWRWDSPAVIKWAGKPITGYHVFLNLFILLLLHLPVVYSGFTAAREAELLSLYFLIAVFWDLLWFVCNPHFGFARLTPRHVWWFKGWWMGLPAAYYSGLAASAGIYIASAWADGTPWRARALRWSFLFAQFLALTLLTMAVAARRARSAVPAAPPAPDQLP